MNAVRALALVAGALGLLSAVAGSPYRQQHVNVDVEQLARLVTREDDHVGAVELAKWIKERRAGLRVVDVRPAADFDAYHVPTAERIALDSLVATPFRADDTIVLYSEGGAHAAQGWVFLRALGYRNVFFLRGGLYEWIDVVMNPTIADDAPPSEQAEFARVSVLSQYFGGVPRSGVPRPTTDGLSLPTARGDTNDTDSLVRRVRRRGC